MDNIPKKIGKYDIEKLIAEGGMGAVYKGMHPTLERNIILKKLTLNDSSQFIQRFNREAKIMMDFKNDNIVDVYDHFEEEGSYYIVLEYIDGISLEQLIKKEGTLSNELAIHIVLEISKALKYAHIKNVVHRDVKPANILIAKNGEVKLVDFGIAQTENDSSEDLTTVGMTLGTPSYMAPEQFENSKFVDKRADIYSLGVVLYEMVTGEKPFPSGLSPDCIYKIQKGRYKAPYKINPNVNSTVSTLVHGLMHHKINKRVQDLDIIITKLRRYLKKERMTLYRERLSDSVAGRNTIKLPTVRKRNKLVLIPVALVFIIVATYILLTSGYIHEIFNSSTYGAIKITLKVSKKYYKEFDEIFIKSKLFSESGTELKLIDNSNFALEYIANETDEVYTYTTETIYLPIGFYRLKFMVDGNLFWKNVNLHSIKNNSTELIILEHKESKGLPFHPTLTVQDQLTGVNLTDDATIYIQKNGKFERFNRNDKTLLTGETHYFQFSKKGYYPKDYILKIGPDQTDLRLDAEIYPKPGSLKIITNEPKIKITINGDNYYIKGDRSGEKIKLGKLGKESSELLLNPGIYKVTLTYWGNSIEKEVKIISGENISLNIKYSKDNKSLSLDNIK